MNEKLLTGIFVGVEGAHAFSAFMPSWFTIRKFSTQDQSDLARLRSGYVPAVIFNLVLGVTVSGLIKSAWPVLLSVLVCIFMVAMYESAINVEVSQL